MTNRFKLTGHTKQAPAGTYIVVRVFDEKRVLVQLNPPHTHPRILTLLPLELGEMV